jgi:uncharacterized membrane protein
VDTSGEMPAVIETISEIIDLSGVAIIASGAALGVVIFVRDLIRQAEIVTAYGRLRTFLGRSLLLGLEFLVAGDIIKTVAIEPTFNSVIVLAIIVLVRTVLSLSIDVEIDGRWPWQSAAANAARAAPASTGGQQER